MHFRFEELFGTSNIFAILRMFFNPLLFVPKRISWGNGIGDEGGCNVAYAVGHKSKNGILANVALAVNTRMGV